MIRTPTTSGRLAARGLLLLAALAALLVLAAPAAAAQPCARTVIDDWYDNGRVDGTYPLRCYDDAIESLPRDVADYSSAKEDIQRALQARMRGEASPPARTDPTPGTTTSDDPVTSPEDPVEEPTDTSSTPPGAGPDDGDGEGEVAGPLETESASSVPIPLLILAALALLLVLGGSAGYLIRRYQARRPPPTAA